MRTICFCLVLVAASGALHSLRKNELRTATSAPRTHDEHGFYHDHGGEWYWDKSTGLKTYTVVQTVVAQKLTEHKYGGFTYLVDDKTGVTYNSKGTAVGIWIAASNKPATVHKYENRPYFVDDTTKKIYDKDGKVVGEWRSGHPPLLNRHYDGDGKLLNTGTDGDGNYIKNYDGDGKNNLAVVSVSLNTETKKTEYGSIYIVGKERPKVNEELFTTRVTMLHKRGPAVDSYTAHRLHVDHAKLTTLLKAKHGGRGSSKFEKCITDASVHGGDKTQVEKEKTCVAWAVLSFFCDVKLDPTKGFEILYHPTEKKHACKARFNKAILDQIKNGKLKSENPLWAFSGDSVASSTVDSIELLLTIDDIPTEFNPNLSLIEVEIKDGDFHSFHLSRGHIIKLTGDETSAGGKPLLNGDQASTLKDAAEECLLQCIPGPGDVDGIRRDDKIDVRYIWGANKCFYDEAVKKVGQAFADKLATSYLQRKTGKPTS